MINVRQIIVDVEKELRSHLSQNHIPFNEAVFVNPFSGVRGDRSDVNQGVYNAIEWAKTGRAGKIYNNAFAALGTDTCSSRYGLCE